MKNLFCLTLFCALTAAAQVQPPTPVLVPEQSQTSSEAAEETEPKEPGRLSGVVLLAGSDAPVRKATVTLYGREVRGSLNATTGPDGAFVFEKAPPGDYSLNARHVRFVPVDSQGEYASFGSRKISVSEGQSVEGVVFKMMPGAVITGTVYDEYGDPQPGAQVNLQRYRYRDGKRQMSSARGDRTDDRGQYRIYNVPPGKYYLAVHYQDRSWGRSVPQGEQPDMSYPAVFYPGVLDAETAMELDLRANQELSGMDLRLVLERSARLRGKVMLGGKPARDVHLMMMKAGSMDFSSRKSQQADPKTGEFEFAGLQPGTYTVMALTMGRRSDERLQGRAKVQVGSSDVEGLLITLGPGMNIPGQVIVEAEGTPVDFDVRTTYITLSALERGPFGGGAGGSVKPDGTFELDDVQPGVYRLRVRPLPEGGYLSGAVLGDQDIFGQEFEIVPGTQGPLTVRIRMTAARIEGVVQDDNGNPVPNVRVLLVPDSSRRARPDLFATDGTDQYGKFSFKSVAPGEYKLWALEKLEYGRHMDPEFLAVIEDEGEKVDADDSGTHNLTLELTELPE